MEEEWKRSTSTSTTRHTARGCLLPLWHVFSIILFWPSAVSEEAKTAFLYLLEEHETSSRRRGPNAWPVFYLKGWGGAILTSKAERRETWSGQQDVINVTSSVGTRGSSTVHSDSSREEREIKSEFLSHQKVSSRSQVDLASSSCGGLGLLGYKSVFQLNVAHKICWEQW